MYIRKNFVMGVVRVMLVLLAIALYEQSSRAILADGASGEHSWSTALSEVALPGALRQVSHGLAGVGFTFSAKSSTPVDYSVQVLTASGQVAFNAESVDGAIPVSTSIARSAELFSILYRTSSGDLAEVRRFDGSLVWQGPTSHRVTISPTGTYFQIFRDDCEILDACGNRLWSIPGTRESTAALFSSDSLIFVYDQSRARFFRSATGQLVSSVEIESFCGPFVNMSAKLASGSEHVLLYCGSGFVLLDQHGSILARKRLNSQSRLLCEGAISPSTDMIAFAETDSGTGYIVLYDQEANEICRQQVEDLNNSIQSNAHLLYFADDSNLVLLTPFLNYASDYCHPDNKTLVFGIDTKSGSLRSTKRFDGLEMLLPSTELTVRYRPTIQNSLSLLREVRDEH